MHQLRKRMTREELAKQYFNCWNQKNVPELLKLMHSQASYHDAFWGETCSGPDLAKYFDANFKVETRWYRPEGEIIATPNGLIVRYLAFSGNDPEGLTPILNGAEIITLSGELIMTVSDFYCGTDPVELIEIAALTEQQHARAHIAPLGLGAGTSARIKQRLAGLADNTTVFLQPSLTVTQLADHVGCSVMHLFHVLEEEKETTFRNFVNECRARHATTLMADTPSDDVRLDHVAKQSGFESVEEFRDAFQATFGITADEYLQQFAK
jgi:AraC-like DNA-binding protein